MAHLTGDCPPQLCISQALHCRRGSLGRGAVLSAGGRHAGRGAAAAGGAGAGGRRAAPVTHAAPARQAYDNQEGVLMHS